MTLYINVVITIKDDCKSPWSQLSRLYNRLVRPTLQVTGHRSTHSIITLEPPEGETIAARLAQRGVTDLETSALHSDPENHLLLRPAEALYVINIHELAQPGFLDFLKLQQIEISLEPRSVERYVDTADSFPQRNQR